MRSKEYHEWQSKIEKLPIDQLKRMSESCGGKLSRHEAFIRLKKEVKNPSEIEDLAWQLMMKVWRYTIL